MDIELSLVVLSQKELIDYKNKIQSSNLEKIIQGELIYLLETAAQQTKEAKKMGWIR